ncbi:hypothetical protein DFH06DRAFT_1168875 [Mycena polygramma]|nr:hypothetical protein DFH06DRAFT_1168875 [Mycena polygramma]
MQPFLRRTLYWSEYTVWIRVSTGRPCIELAPPEGNSARLLGFHIPFQLVGKSLLEPPVDFAARIGSLSLEDYHNICYSCQNRWQHFSISKNIFVKLGSIRHFPSPEYQGSLEIAFVPGSRVYDCGWSTRDPIVLHAWTTLSHTWETNKGISCNPEGTSMLENGWIRINSVDAADTYRRRIWADNSGSRVLSRWLAQANHIFHCLNITCSVQRCFLLEVVDYRLELSGPTHDLPPGYLFICPLAELQSDLAYFRVPDCPAYWSLDPSGVEGLNADEASVMGFSDIKFHMAVGGRSWDDNDYAGIRTFHESRGFDAYTQEAAIAMGCPLVEMTCDRYALLGHSKSSGIVADSSKSEAVEYLDFTEKQDERVLIPSPVDAVPSDCDEVRAEGERILPSNDEPDGPHVHATDRKSIYHSRNLDAEIFKPSRSWSIVMSVQFALLIVLGSFLMHELFLC